MTKRCEVCGLDLQDEYAYKGHILGKKHLRNVQQIETKKKLVENSIFVTRYPPYYNPRSLLSFFLDYGEIERYRLGDGYVIIEFKEKAPVDFLLNNPIWLDNQYKLDIKRRRMHDNYSRGENKTDEAQEITELCYDNLKSIFQEETTFDSQLAAFLKAVQLSDADIEAQYESVCTNLNQIFKAVFPKCSAHRFGSTVTGLGFKKCDLDVFLNIGEPISDAEEAPPNVWTQRRVFNLAKKLMYRRDCVFSKITPIPKAKTPIIKFCHVPTNISCDISFKNGLGTHNSYLIKYYLSLDSRVRPLMVCIKYWARIFELSGCGKMSNYALVMLTIFYLQQPSVKIVPTVVELQKSCDPITVDGWQVNFNQFASFPPTSNTSTIPELLHGFFEFYANFEYKLNVICPLDGSIRTKVDFNTVEELPESMTRYKNHVMEKGPTGSFGVDKTMCVQDPIELSHNLTPSLSTRGVESFQIHCAVSEEVCATAIKNNCTDLLAALFTTRPKRKEDVGSKIIIPVGKFIRAGLPPNVDARSDIIDKNKFIRENWYHTIFELIHLIFEQVLKLRVELLPPEGREMKQQKVELQSDVHSRNNDKILFHCTGSHILFCNRKNKKLLLDPSLSLLRKEIMISEHMFNEQKSTAGTSNLKLDFTCLFEKKLDKSLGPHVVLQITNKYCSKNLFRELNVFLNGKIPAIINKTLLHMLQYDKQVHDC